MGWERSASAGQHGERDDGQHHDGAGRGEDQDRLAPRGQLGGPPLAREPVLVRPATGAVEAGEVGLELVPGALHQCGQLGRRAAGAGRRRGRVGHQHLVLDELGLGGADRPPRLRRPLLAPAQLLLDSLLGTAHRRLLLGGRLPAALVPQPRQLAEVPDAVHVLVPERIRHRRPPPSRRRSASDGNPNGTIGVGAVPSVRSQNSARCGWAEYRTNGPQTDCTSPSGSRRNRCPPTSADISYLRWLLNVLSVLHQPSRYRCPIGPSPTSSCNASDGLAPPIVNWSIRGARCIPGATTYTGRSSLAVPSSTDASRSRSRSPRSISAWPTSRPACTVAAWPRART